MTKEIPRNEARHAIAEVALEQLAQRGPANVHPKDICEGLGLSKALVNYHFGGRDGLIAEAMVDGYDRYGELLKSAVESAGSDPIERLTAFVEAHVDWTRENVGLAVALHFPYMASGMPEELLEHSVERLNDAGARNFATLKSLIAGVTRHLRPSGEERSDMETTLDAACVSWLLIGMAVWNAGKHLPSQRLEGTQYFDIARKHALDQVFAMLAR